MTDVLDRLRTQHARNVAARPSQMADFSGTMMTDKQHKFIDDLLKQWIEIDTGYDGADAASWVCQRIHTFTRVQASEVIERLIKRVNEAKRKRPDDGRPSVPAGRYALEGPDGAIHFYRVYITRNDRSYVTLHNAPSPHMPYAAALATLKEIAADPKGAAIRFGRELGICGRCGRDLTDAESRAAGIGPVCASKDW